MIAHFKENCIHVVYVYVCVRVIVTMKQAAIACRKYTYTPYRKGTGYKGSWCRKERKKDENQRLGSFYESPFEHL